MDSTEIKEKLLNAVSALQNNNVTLRNNLSNEKKQTEKDMDEVFCEFLTVIDTFDRSEKIIKERKLDEDENASRVMKRLLNAKKKAMFVLEKYNVKKIDFPEGKAIDELCVVTDTEPDSTRQTGEIVSIEKDGYTRNGHVIRPADVVIVKN